MIEINEKKSIKLEVVLIELRKNVFKRVYLDNIKVGIRLHYIHSFSCKKREVGN